MAELFGKHGGFRRLYSFTLATIVQIETLRFCRHFLTFDHRETATKFYGPRGRQYDHMTQAARASLSELRGDYEIFILDRDQLPWSVHSQEARALNAISLDAPPFKDGMVHESAKHALEQQKKYARWLDAEAAVVVANALLLIISRALNMLKSQIQHMTMTTFWHPDGPPMSAQQFMELLFGRLPDFFSSDEELRQLWSAPDTRATLLAALAEKDFGHDALVEMQNIIGAENSDLFDVLAYVAYAMPPVSREQRANLARVHITSSFNTKQQAFLDFVLAHHISVGVEELDQQKLTPLLRLKYGAIQDAVADLGQPEEIGKAFAGFQKYLYARRVA
jgi:hypothetical protein